jgi:hypothetical protein
MPNPKCARIGLCPHMRLIGRNESDDACVDILCRLIEGATIEQFRDTAPLYFSATGLQNSIRPEVRSRGHYGSCPKPKHLL